MILSLVILIIGLPILAIYAWIVKAKVLRWVYTGLCGLIFFNILWTTQPKHKIEYKQTEKQLQIEKEQLLRDNEILQNYLIPINNQHFMKDSGRKLPEKYLSKNDFNKLNEYQKLFEEATANYQRKNEECQAGVETYEPVIKYDIERKKYQTEIQRIQLIKDYYSQMNPPRGSMFNTMFQINQLQLNTNQYITTQNAKRFKMLQNFYQANVISHDDFITYDAANTTLTTQLQEEKRKLLREQKWIEDEVPQHMIRFTDIETLINQLSIDEHKNQESEYQRVSDVARQIIKLEKKALLNLSLYINDEQNSISWKAQQGPSTRGAFCREIINLILYPDPSPPNSGRTITISENPYKSVSTPLIDCEVTDLKDFQVVFWLASRENYTLSELRLDALKCLIADYEKLGLSEQKMNEIREFYTPYLKQYQNEIDKEQSVVFFVEAQNDIPSFKFEGKNYTLDEIIRLAEAKNFKKIELYAKNPIKKSVINAITTHFSDRKLPMEKITLPEN